MLAIKILFLTIFLSHISVNESGTFIKFTKIECIPKPDFYYNVTCYLKALNRYRASAFIYTDTKAILKNVSINFALYVRNDANIFNPWLVNFTFNACDYMKNGVANAYVKIALKQLLQEINSTNIYHKCPFDRLMYAENVYLDAINIPVSIPKHYYRGVIKFMEGYPPLHYMTIAINAEIIEKHVRQKN